MRESIRNMKILLLTLPLLALLAFMPGCADSCTENQNALPLAGFYATDSDGSISQVTVDSLEVIGVGIPSDSALSPAGTAKNRLCLPFRIDADRTQYVFINRRKGADTRDTVTFDYDRVVRFVNVECGVSYVFHIHDITSQGTLIDSVTCPGGFIDNTNIENLRIYFRTE